MYFCPSRSIQSMIAFSILSNQSEWTLSLAATFIFRNTKTVPLSTLNFDKVTSFVINKAFTALTIGIIDSVHVKLLRNRLIRSPGHLVQFSLYSQKIELVGKSAVAPLVCCSCSTSTVVVLVGAGKLGATVGYCLVCTKYSLTVHYWIKSFNSFFSSNPHSSSTL